jgi:hypothetical protein
LDRLAAIHLFLVPNFLLLLLLNLSLYLSQLRMTQRQCGSPLSLSSLAGTLSSSFPTYIFPVSVLFLDPAKNSDYHLMQHTRGLTDTLP